MNRSSQQSRTFLFTDRDKRKAIWRQSIEPGRSYPGADGSFALFQDDGTTNGYEKGGGLVTKLTWDDKAQRLNQEGAPAWRG